MNKTILFILLSVFLASNMQAQKRHTADRTRVAKEQVPVAPAKKAEAVSPKKKSQVRSTTAVAKRKRKATVAEPTTTPFAISPTLAVLDAAGGKKVFYVSSEKSWYISTWPNSWGHLSKEGNYLTLQVDANTSTNSRKDYFCLKSGNQEIRVDITQKGADEPSPKENSLSVSASSLRFSADSGTVTITVSSSADWHISVGTASWGHLSRSGNVLTISVDENKTGNARADYFKLSNGTVEKKITITQSARNAIRIPLYGTTRTYADSAVGLSLLTNYIKKWNGKCRLGTLTDGGAGVVVHGMNDCAYKQAWSEFAANLRELRTNGNKIASICMTRSGYHCVVFGRNSWRGNIPAAMKKELLQYERNNEQIYCVSISENGRYLIITDRHLTGSDTNVIAVLEKAGKMYGHLKYACVTNLGVVVVCKNGIYYHNIPTTLEMAMKSLYFWPDKVVFTDAGTYLITNENEDCRYNM